MVRPGKFTLQQKNILRLQRYKPKSNSYIGDENKTEIEKKRTDSKTHSKGDESNRGYNRVNFVL